MVQSMTQLPKTADVQILGLSVTIRDHKVVNINGLFDRIMCIIQSSNSDRRTLCQLEKHGIGFEAVIEYCAQEIQSDSIKLADIINWQYDSWEDIKPDMLFKESIVLVFSKNGISSSIADQIEEKIRDCDDWGELYDEMHPTSEFIKDIENRIRKNVQQCHKV